MSKQTSIEWLLNAMESLAENFIEKNISKFEYDTNVEWVKEKAKQMHKEEIVKAYRDGRTDQQSGIDKWYNRSSNGYYQETYGSSPKTSDN